ncbi:hypothetical protein AQJ30_23700 [Streptomyces longwoodensis]|uniref:Uncharacterized protein n=1 Tax=Streptomyces longwoodensis TaxID=68231 RepID=A0A101QTL9_9ACTN|nr:hypothetical protein AQJ30_23700 [Streptomyces longwoodensis]
MAPVREHRRDPVGEALAGTRVLHDPLGASGSRTGAVGVLGVAVLLDDPPARPRLENQVVHAQIVGRPPLGEQSRLRQMAPDQPGGRRQRAVEPERAAVGPAGLPCGEPFHVQAAPVAVVRRARTAGPVRVTGEPQERGGQVPQGGCLQRVHTALSAALGGDDSGPLEGLEVLGGLRLARPGKLGEDPDRAGPLGQQGDQPQAGRVGQCGRGVRP